MDEKTLLTIKRKIDDARTELSELKGRERYLFQQLKTEFDCDTVEAAEKKREEMDEEIEKLNQSIRQGVLELQERYEL